MTFGDNKMDEIRKIIAGWYFLGLFNIYDVLKVAVIMAIVDKSVSMMPQVTDLMMVQISSGLDMIAVMASAYVIYRWSLR